MSGFAAILSFGCHDWARFPILDNRNIYFRSKPTSFWTTSSKLRSQLRPGPQDWLTIDVFTDIIFLEDLRGPLVDEYVKRSTLVWLSWFVISDNSGVNHV
jgi:hypothetical protein